MPANFLVIHILNKYSMRVCLVTGGLLLLLGSWLRQLLLIFANNNFPLAATSGNCICAFAQVFFGNCASKLASEWFGDGERALSTALGTLAMPVGCIAGFIVPAVMVKEEDLKEPAEGREKFVRYLFIQNCIATVATLPVIFLVRSKPPTPPSLSASQHHVTSQ